MVKNLRTIIFILIGITFFFACNDSPAPPNCSQYKNGDFYFHFKDGEKLGRFTVTRKGPVQTEKNEENGNSSTYKILWTDSCSYDLIFIEGTEDLPNDLLNYKRKLVIHTTVLSGTNKYYLFKSTSDLNDHVLQDTMWLTNLHD
jgi:hypothetical protein